MELHGGKTRTVKKIATEMVVGSAKTPIPVDTTRTLAANPPHTLVPKPIQNPPTPAHNPATLTLTKQGSDQSPVSRDMLGYTMTVCKLFTPMCPCHRAV